MCQTAKRRIATHTEMEGIIIWGRTRREAELPSARARNTANHTWTGPRVALEE